MKTRMIMKKRKRGLLVGLIAVAVMMSCTATSSFAAQSGGANIDSVSRVTLSATQTNFTLPLSIDYATAYAAVELAVQCGDGVTIESVDYSKDISHAGPTEARGLVWFTTFSGSNAYTGNLTATIHVKYEGKGNSSLVVDHAAFHTVEGSAFRTENVPLRRTVEIVREGESYTPPPLEPPTGGNPPGAGNPPPGDTLNSPDPGNPQSGAGDSTQNSSNPAGDNSSGKTSSSKSSDKSSSKSSTTGSSGSSSSTVIDRNTTATKAIPTTNEATAAVPAIVATTPLEAGATGEQNEHITTGEAEDQPTSISSSKVPYAGGNANTTTPNGDVSALSMATFIMALACLAALAFLGFLFIKRKRDEKKNKQNKEKIKEVM
jgi:hypothetical protein